MYVSNIYSSGISSDCSIMETFFTFVCVELSNDTKTSFLSSVYKPPNCYLSDFYALDKLLKLIVKMCTQTIISFGLAKYQ